jgi:hypothetical protein
MTARVAMLLKSRAFPDMLPFRLCKQEKTCYSAHEQTPLSDDTIDFVLRHREVGRDKDLSAHRRMFHVRADSFQYSKVRILLTLGNTMPDNCSKKFSFPLRRMAIVE